MADHTSRQPQTNKQAPVTHFLCLPLVNSTSMPQLEASLSAFKTAHQSIPGFHSTTPDQKNHQRLGLPDKAFRPLGTLHLTLGVMSLPKERLAQASSLLQSLDLTTMMYEAERVGTHSRHGTSQVSKDIPFTVSLESLHALPRANLATILHASPVDPTGRLYPFCVMLRDKFIEAGFMHTESDKRKPNPSPTKESARQDTHNSQSTSSGNASLHRNATPNNLDPYTVAITRQPKPRPLLLHATLVNTVYVRGRPSIQDRKTKAATTNKRITFDARNLVSRSTAHPPRVAAAPNPPAPNHTYIWAREIPLDAICICEMGAKRLHPKPNDPRHLNQRLGEQYQVVAQRSLNLPRPSQQSQQSQPPRNRRRP